MSHKKRNKTYPPNSIYSNVFGRIVPDYDVQRIAEYMNCPFKTLNCQFRCCGRTNTPPDELLIKILSMKAETTKFRLLQVKISKVILGNIIKGNVQAETLMSLKLRNDKISSLLDCEIREEQALAFDIMDIFIISRKFNMELDYLFTGVLK